MLNAMRLMDEHKKEANIVHISVDELTFIEQEKERNKCLGY